MRSMSFWGRRIPISCGDQGEAYRESLVARVRELGIENHVVFLDQFVDQATLLDFISMCDVYVTPYLNEAQMTSGTLAYSFGLGKAGRLDALLARAGTAGRRTRHPGAIWRCRRYRQRDRGVAHRRCPAPGDARARLCEQPLDDMGANTPSATLPRSKAHGGAHRLEGDRADRAKACRSHGSHAAPEMQPRPFSVHVRRHRALPACGPLRARSSRMAIASMTMPGRCCWPARSTTQARSACRKH